MHFSVLLLLTITSAQIITLKDNGYSGILIGISEAVPENPELIEKITSIFNGASSLLYNATRNRAYFANITILIPSSWTMDALNARSETYDSANIKIDVKSEMGDNPYVKAPGGCGVEGLYMHLTTNYLLNSSYFSRLFGPHEKVLIHEWAHLRWGVKDEYPLTGNKFYQSAITESIEATRCNLDIKGSYYIKGTREKCVKDPNTQLYGNDCVFYPSFRETSSKSSMMSYHFIPSVQEFCDDSTDYSREGHNFEAPSAQNDLCSGQSVWSVIRKSTDFSNGSNPPFKFSGSFPSIKFKVVKRNTKQNLVICMDVSGSMVGGENHIKLVNAVQGYLLYTVNMGTKVGLVKYSSSARALTDDLIEIKSMRERQLLADLLLPEANGGTGIGLGLLASLQLLNKTGLVTSMSSRIILLTDGQENVNPRVRDVLPIIQAAGVLVDTILLTESASDTLSILAAATGGDTLFSSGDDNSTSLNDIYSKLEEKRAISSENRSIGIFSQVVTVGSVNKTCFSVMIDKTIGRDNLFKFSWTQKIPLQIVIRRPSGFISNATLSSSGTSANYLCAGECERGEWSVCLSTNSTTSTTEQVEASVESKARLTTNGTFIIEPITVRADIINKEPDFNKTGYVVILATVMQGYSAVISANVSARLNPPKAQLEILTIQLRDDGAGADITKDDGVYSGIILNTADVGKYSISIAVSGGENTKAKTLTAKNPVLRVNDPELPVTVDEVTITPTENFQRFSLAGFIDVKSINTNGKDTFPPSKIIDFKIVNASYVLSQITLQWTAVGEDMDEGRASSYEIWRADDYRTLYFAFEKATKINQSDVLYGNLSNPSPAYSTEKFIVRVQGNKTHVYTVIAKDEEGNPSPISNLVSVKLTTEVPKMVVDVQNIGGMIVAVIVSLCLLLAVCIFMTFTLINSAQKKKNVIHFNP